MIIDSVNKMLELYPENEEYKKALELANALTGKFLNESKSHLIPVKVNKFIYHTSNPIFRDKISKDGLIPKGKSESWLSNTNIDGDVIFAVNSIIKEEDDYIICDLICENTTMPNLTIAKSQIDKWKINT